MLDDRASLRVELALRRCEQGCSGCRAWLALEAFGRDRNRASKRDKYCPPCRKAKNREDYEAHNAQRIARALAWQAARRGQRKRAMEHPREGA